MYFKIQQHTKSSIYLDQTLETTFLYKQLVFVNVTYQFCIFFWMKDFKHFPVFTSWSCRLGTPAVPSLAAATKICITVQWSLEIKPASPWIHSTSQFYKQLSMHKPFTRTILPPEGLNPKLLIALPTNISLSTIFQSAERTTFLGEGLLLPIIRLGQPTAQLL